MYAQNDFSQSHRYIHAPRYPQNHLPFMGNWYYSAQQAVPANENSKAAILMKRQENTEFIENFVNESKEYCSQDKNIGNRKKTLRISEAREIAINVCRMQKTLEMMSEKMRKSENFAVSEWQEKWQKCTELRNEITKLMDRFGDVEGIVDSLKKRVDQRGRKRRREARKKGQLKVVEKAIAFERRVARHAEADAWIREKQDVIEREKQVQLLRKDADIVLADVRGKRSDAKKFLGLLQELQNLRRVKVNIARARGENLPLAADQAFDNIIGQLLDQWTCLDREYSFEEQGLKLMLKTDEEKIQKQKRSTFDDWESVLFGRKVQSCDSTRGDAHTFLIIRHAWDKYANYKNQGSRIPIGWVMPVIPSSAAWQKSLRRE